MGVWTLAVGTGPGGQIEILQDGTTVLANTDAPAGAYDAFRALFDAAGSDLDPRWPLRLESRGGYLLVPVDYGSIPVNAELEGFLAFPYWLDRGRLTIGTGRGAIAFLSAR